MSDERPTYRTRGGDDEKSGRHLRGLSNAELLEQCRRRRESVDGAHRLVNESTLADEERKLLELVEEVERRGLAENATE